MKTSKVQETDFKLTVLLLRTKASHGQQFVGMRIQPSHVTCLLSPSRKASAILAEKNAILMTSSGRNSGIASDWLLRSCIISIIRPGLYVA